MQTSGRYSAIPSSRIHIQHEPLLDGSDAADESQRLYSFRLEHDDRSWVAVQLGRCEEQFIKHRNIFYPLLFVPSALAAAGGTFALLDDPDDTVTYVLAYAAAGAAAIVALLGICHCRRVTPELK